MRTLRRLGNVEPRRRLLKKKKKKKKKKKRRRRASCADAGKSGVLRKGSAKRARRERPGGVEGGVSGLGSVLPAPLGRWACLEAAGRVREGAERQGARKKQEKRQKGLRAEALLRQIGNYIKKKKKKKKKIEGSRPLDLLRPGRLARLGAPPPGGGARRPKKKKKKKKKKSSPEHITASNRSPSAHPLADAFVRAQPRYSPHPWHSEAAQQKKIAEAVATSPPCPKRRWSLDCGQIV